MVVVVVVVVGVVVGGGVVVFVVVVVVVVVVCMIFYSLFSLKYFFSFSFSFFFYFRAEVDVAIRDGKLVSIARHFGPTIDDWHIRLLQFYQDHGLDKQEHEITDTKKIEEAWMVGENPINPEQCLDTIGSLLKYLEYKVRTLYEHHIKY